MKNILIVRHGSYNIDTGELDHSGKAQIERLAERLRPMVIGEAAILTSTSLRAEQTADILGGRFNVKVEKFSYLESGSGIRFRPLMVQSLLKRRYNRIDTAIIVTHFEYSEALPRLISEKLLHCNGFPYEPLFKGEAWHIDCIQDTCVRIT